MLIEVTLGHEGNEIAESIQKHFSNFKLPGK